MVCKTPSKPLRGRKPRDRIIDMGHYDPKTESHTRVYWRSEILDELQISLSTFKRYLMDLIIYNPEFARNWVSGSERLTELHRYYFLALNELKKNYSGQQLRKMIGEIPCQSKRTN